MSNDEKVSEGDLSSLSLNELVLTPVGSVLNPAVAQQVIQDDIDQCKTDLMENEGRFGERGVSKPSLEENDINSQLLDEEGYSAQESVSGSNDMNEMVNIQSNGTSTHVEEFDGDSGHKLDANDRESSPTSIQVVDSSNPIDANNFTSSEGANADVLAKYSKETEVGNSELLDPTLSLSTASPHCQNTLPNTTKGFGLKKWRRIKREIVTDPTPCLDSTKMLKRGSPDNLDAKQPNECSVSSTNAFWKSRGHSDQFSHPINRPNHTLDVDTIFSTGSDDEDDRSSKSSTAASAPKHRRGLLSATGNHQREKHRMKNVSGQQLNSSDQRFQTGEGQPVADTSKKARGVNIHVEKPNSLSSMDSDSRGYSSVFVTVTNSGSDQLQSERSANFEGEDSHDQQNCEVQSAIELQVDHSRSGDLSPECSAELSCKNNRRSSKDRLSTECEPLFNSILMLQSAQEALEREVQLFKELGQGMNSLCGDFGKTSGGSTDAMFSTSEACTGHYPDSQGSESNHFYSRKSIQTIERQLDEAEVRLKEKNLRLLELEMAVSSMESHQADARNTLELQHTIYQDMEAELEVLFKQNVEAEVQYIVMTKSTKYWSSIVDDQIQLLRDHTSEKCKQAELVSDGANKIAVLQGQAKLDASNKDITGDDLRKIKKRIVNFMSCLFIQLILLALVLRLLLLQRSPRSATVVPT